MYEPVRVEFLAVRKGYEVNNYITHIERTFLTGDSALDWVHEKFKRHWDADCYVLIKGTTYRWATSWYIPAFYGWHK